MSDAPLVNRAYADRAVVKQRAWPGLATAVAPVLGQSESPQAQLIAALASTAHARLRALTFIGACTFGIGVVVSMVLPAILGRPAWEREVMGALCGFLTVVSLLVRWFASRPQVTPERIIAMGLSYVAVAALAMAVAEVTIGPRANSGYEGIPGMCLWIVIFPLIIPSMPSQAFVTALGCAATLPVMYAIAVSCGRDACAPNILVRWMAPGFFCAGLAYALAWVIGRLALDLARTRRALSELGAYQLEERIGGGGMGEVWRARHRLLPRSAAVKFVRPAADLKRDPAMARALALSFEREAKSIALLRSPHTVQIYDVGVSPEGDLFYAMELLDGIDLETLVQRHGPMPEARVAACMAQACLSLAEAHGNGLIHRDVKPGNLMLCRLGENFDVIKVLDFGLVGMAQGSPLAVTASPAQSGVSGTPGYIAPELMFGGGTTDARSDLYGLGAVMYHLLCGTTVFPSADGGEDLVAHSMDLPKPPSVSLGKLIHPELEQLVLACLAKRPEHRPASALAVREQLLAIRFGLPWNERDARQWWLRTLTPPSANG